MNLENYAANPKYTLMLGTHNYYDAKNYQKILDSVIGPDGYYRNIKTRDYTSHEGERDFRTFWIFAAKVSKETETRIRYLINRSKYVPNWTIDMEEN